MLKGDVHVVLAGHKASCHYRYVADMGLTNVEVFKYRKMDEDTPLRSLRLRCGITVHERLLLPNKGKEAIAFYSYLLEFYHKLPHLAVFLLHDHGAAWHQTCQALFARSRLWYQEAAQRRPLAARMISFTSQNDENMSDWAGGRRRLLDKASNHDLTEGQIAVAAILEKWNVPAAAVANPRWASCCSSFILPTWSISKLPKGLIEDLHGYIAAHQDDEVSGRVALEHIGYGLFAADFMDGILVNFYAKAKEAALQLLSNPALGHCQANTCY